MTKYLTLLFLTFGVAESAFSQKVVYRSPKKVSDVAATTIVTKLATILRVIRDTPLKPGEWRLTLFEPARGIRTWTATGKGLRFSFYSKTGNVAAFYDRGTRDRYLKGQMKQSGNRKYPTAFGAAQAMEKIAHEIGFPIQLKWVRPQTNETQRSPEKHFTTFSCAFADAKGKEKGTMAMDAYTGLVTEFWLAESQTAN